MRNRKKVVIGLLALTGSGVPAVAAVTINSADIGYSFTLDYGGQVNAQPTDQISALGFFTFSGLSPDGLTYLFDYSLQNTSAVNSRIRSFGFTTTPNILAASSSGTYQYASYGSSQQFPGISDMEMCFTPTSNGQCNGGPGGLSSGQTGTGSFALSFAQPIEAFVFDDFAVRYQSINPGLNGGGTSGVGQGSVVQSETVSAAPELATWAMMILGFGLIGVAMRRWEFNLDVHPKRFASGARLRDRKPTQIFLGSLPRSL